jgi:TetR/AcrR family transcriptional regulator, fatty acid metabolism regulator protein
LAARAPKSEKKRAPAVRARIRTRSAKTPPRPRTRRPAGPAPSIESARQAAHQRQRRTVEREAERLFAVRGYRGTSIHLVAARCRCSVGHLYNLYGSKLDLYRALLETKMDRLGGVVESCLRADATSVERMAMLLDEVLRFFEANSAFFRIYAMETGVRLWRSNLPFVEHIGRWHADLLERVAGLVREGQAVGELRAGIDPILAAVSLIGMVKGHTTEWVLQGEEGSLVVRSRGILELCLRGLQPGVHS